MKRKMDPTVQYIVVMLLIILFILFILITGTNLLDKILPTITPTLGTL